MGYNRQVFTRKMGYVKKIYKGDEVKFQIAGHYQWHEFNLGSLDNVGGKISVV